MLILHENAKRARLLSGAAAHEGMTWQKFAQKSGVSVTACIWRCYLVEYRTSESQRRSISI